VVFVHHAISKKRPIERIVKHMSTNDVNNPTPFERFDSLLKRVIAVPNAEIKRREAEYKKQRKAAKDQRSHGSQA